MVPVGLFGSDGRAGRLFGSRSRGPVDGRRAMLSEWVVTCVWSARCEILCPVFVGRCQGKAVGIGRDSELPVERVEPESGCQILGGIFR